MSPRGRPGLFIGLMSGTSLDGVDCALVAFERRPRLLASHFIRYESPLKTALLALNNAGVDEIDRSAGLAIEITGLYARAVNEMLATAGISAGEITAIGCHGQTVRHCPASGYSVQISSPALLAERTGVTVVSDFRSRDIAAGGQGAPLVPAFHAAVFRSGKRHRVVVNIGGIANITDLPPAGPVLGFDTGPGNLLLDAWTKICLSADFDRDGELAARGGVVPGLLDELLADDFFHRSPPKSTGREHFNAAWLQAAGLDRWPITDVQATLSELTACTIAAGIDRYCPRADEVYVCGGGAHNRDLIARLCRRIGTRRLRSTADLGIDPDWVEAVAFAWLARQTLNRKPGNVPEVTGAAGPRILGAIYPA